MSSDKKKQDKAKALMKARPPQTPRKPPHFGLGRGLDALMGGPVLQKPADAVSAGGQMSHAGVTPAMPEAATRTGGGVLLAADRPPAAPAVDAAHTVFEVPTAEISRSPWQPRQSFDEAAMNELADSIRTNGVIQPLICRKLGDGQYELIAGERRLRAAIAAGLTKVPVVLMDAEDRKAAEMAIIENIQRQDLNVIEEAFGYRTLADKFSLTQQEVADRVGKPRPSVANSLRLLDLPDEVKQLVGSGMLSTGHAKLLLGIADATKQTLLGRKCVTDGLTVRKLERLIKRMADEDSGKAPVSTGKPDMPESYVRDLTDRLHERFGTSVKLIPGITHANGKHSKGVLAIDFYDNDDLDRLLALLGVSVN
jgi:ParB family chromosome partitioning protein